jgi:hypothetical protein
VIPDTLDHATQGELQKYENNYKVLNLITTALDRNVYDRVSHPDMTHDVWLKLSIHMRALPRLSLHVEILITDSIRLSLRNLESPLMIALLTLSRLLAVYVHVILLHTLTMTVLSSCYMHLMTLCGA